MNRISLLAQQLAETACGSTPMEIAAVVAAALEADATLVQQSRKLLNETELAVIAILANRAAETALTKQTRIGAATRETLDAHRALGLGGRETRAVYELAKDIYQQRKAVQRIEPLISDLDAGELDDVGPPSWIVQHWGWVVAFLVVFTVLMLIFLISSILF